MSGEVDFGIVATEPDAPAEQAPSPKQSAPVKNPLADEGIESLMPDSYQDEKQPRETESKQTRDAPPEKKTETPSKWKAQFKGQDVEVGQDDLPKLLSAIETLQKEVADLGTLKPVAALRDKALRAKDGDIGALAEAMSELGLDLDAVSEARMLEAYKKKMMTPEQRKLAELEAENQRFKTAQQKAEEERQVREAETLRTQASQAVVEDLTKALNDVGLKPTKQILHRTVEIIERSILAERPISAKQALERARTELSDDGAAYYEILTDDALVADERAQKLYDRMFKYYERQARGLAPQSAGANATRPKDTDAPQTRKKKSTDVDEWLKNL